LVAAPGGPDPEARRREKFVHIHPGRYSPNTFRVKANTLKTAIVAEFLALCQDQSPYDIQVVNQARIRLQLSPVDDKISSIYQTIEKLNNFLRKLQNLPPIPRPDSAQSWWQKWMRFFLGNNPKPKAEQEEPGE